jgi:hypothetical protein
VNQWLYSVLNIVVLSGHETGTKLESQSHTLGYGQGPSHRAEHGHKDTVTGELRHATKVVKHNLTSVDLNLKTVTGDKVTYE